MNLNQVENWLRTEMTDSEKIAALQRRVDSLERIVSLLIHAPLRDAHKAMLDHDEKFFSNRKARVS